MDDRRMERQERGEAEGMVKEADELRWMKRKEGEQ